MGNIHDSSEAALNMAIAARALGTPYHVVLRRFNVSSRGFIEHLLSDEFGKHINRPYFWRQVRNLPEFRGTAGQTKALEAILEQEDKRVPLLQFEEVFLRQQYRAVLASRDDGGNLVHMRGYLINPENRKFLAYLALTSHHPLLKSRNRKKVIDGIIGNESLGIEGLPTNLRRYFKELGLENLMAHYPTEEAPISSPFIVLNLFDQAFQERTRNPSLYDLNQLLHLHKSGDKFQLRRGYFDDREKAREEAYHFLTRHNGEYGQLLSSNSRDTVIRGIESMPISLSRYFIKIGLGKLMSTLNPKNSSIAVLKLFDETYMDKTGDKSLFNNSMRAHIVLNGLNEVVRLHSY